uniref:Uncharacterized protein n=1 Tax=Tetranychus urticae TaxID=32264 RepID=T1L0G8_TETUR
MAQGQQRLKQVDNCRQMCCKHGT